jgi:competence protein ComEC
MTEALNWALVLVPKIFVENSWASFRVPVYSGNLKIVYFLYFIPILWLTVRLHRWNPFALTSNFHTSTSKYSLFLSFCFLILFLLLLVFHPFSAPSADGKLKVDFLDVGQGDAAFITFPNGETLLVDGGGKTNFNKEYIERENGEIEVFEPDTATIGEAVVSQFLWEKGYSKIDYIVVSHAHSDHFQGLIDVAKNFQIKAAFFGRLATENEEFAGLLHILQKRNVEIITLSGGDVLNIGEIKTEVLFPTVEFLSENLSENNQSLVLRLIFDEKKILFTGDIEREAEEFLQQTPESLRANVIKVAHHGSRTSSTANFIEASQAELAIISVGKNSPFGHPHREVVERWNSTGAKILTTGENGTITISTDGRNLWLTTFNSP